MGDANDEELAKRRIELEAFQARERVKQLAEEAKKLQEERERKTQEDAANQQGTMVAEQPTAPNWPDDGYQAAPGRLDGVKGALGVGAAGDAALAAQLLNSGQRPLSSATAPEKGADGAKEGIAGSPAAKPALGLG